VTDLYLIDRSGSDLTIPTDVQWEKRAVNAVSGASSQIPEERKRQLVAGSTEPSVPIAILGR